MPRAARGRATRSTRSPATFSLDGHIIETYNHIDDLPQLSSLPKKRPRHATRGATAAERRADRQAAAASEPQPNGMVTRSSRQNLLRHSNSTSPLTAPSPSSEPTDNEYPPISCRVCFKSNTPTKIICCSICRKGVHTFCLNPPVMDLPNDASWKCSKCRRTRLPLKKEARIILRDALSTYSSLCTDNYINAVANVVCVVSDSESPNNKKNANPTKNPKPQPPPPPHKPSQQPPNDNTVVLRVSTDDSDLDSNVEDDIQPNPAVNCDKPQPSRPADRNESNGQKPSSTDPSTPEKHTSPPKKNPPKEGIMPSSATSLDGDDERPLSQLMSRGAQRRHRHAKPHKSKHTDPTLASPKMRLKAKQRRLREVNVGRLQLASSDVKTAREPTNLPPKRRGRKVASRKADKGTHGRPPQVSVNAEKDTFAKNGDQAKQGEISAQPVVQAQTAAPEPINDHIKAESIKEKVVAPSSTAGNEQKKETKDVHSELSEESASNIDEGYPGDTEDDLPLSKRSARYRKPSSPCSNKENNDKPPVAKTNEDHIPEESPPAAPSPVNNERSWEAKQEAIIQDPAGTSNNHANVVHVPKPLAVGAQDSATPAEKPESDPDLKKQSSDSWPKMKLDPKHEALFAMARVQRQQPKPGESSDNHAVSLETESFSTGPKVVSRPKNIPESERQRIQVTALAASNMRRNVSNMASTMAGLRPHSPHVSKGSINLLLQHNQPEVQRDVIVQRPYQPAPDINMPRHSGHLSREEVIQSASDSHRPEREIPSNPPQIYRGVDPRGQEVPTNSGSFRYGDAPTSHEIQPYRLPQHQNVVQNRSSGMAETEVPPFVKRSRVEDMLPHAKRPRNNKSDISNVLSTDSLIPMEERKIMHRDDRMPQLFPEPGRRMPQHPSVPQSTVQGRPSDRQAQHNQASALFSLARCAPQSRFEQPEIRPVNFGMRERLTLPEARMNHNAEGTLGARFPRTGASYPGIPVRNSVAQAESGLQVNREEETQNTSNRAYDSDPIPQVQESGIRTASQAYPPSSIGGDQLPSRLRWPDSNNPAANTSRQDYAGTNTTNQPWSEARVGPVPPQQEGSYNAAAGRFVPIDRRTRRPMPYVPTATRKAQFEQGRALAFIDSRPAPQNADPSETYRMDERSPGLTTRPYVTRPEGQYSGPEYSLPQSGRSRTTYADEESRAQASPYHGDYYVHRQEYRRSSNQESVNDRGSYMAEPQRDSSIRESIGNDSRVVDGTSYGQSRPSMHRTGQPSSGTVLEPPLERNKGVPLERKTASPFTSLVGPGVRSHQGNDVPRMASTFESDRRLPEKHARLTMESGHGERGYYSTSRLQTSSHGHQGFTDAPYGSFHSRRNEALHTPARSIVDARLPAPIHVEGDHYRSRDTTVGPVPVEPFPPSVVGRSGTGTLYSRQTEQIGNRYDYGRGSREASGSMIGQNMAGVDSRNEDYGTDRVSNIPLVARFDNSMGGYMDGNGGGRSSDRGPGMGERPIVQRSEQGQRLPSLRSNPSLRDLLS